MTQDSLKSFLAQFADARQRITEWPQWMQNSARIATASFPKPLTTDQRPPSGEKAQDKKK